MDGSYLVNSILWLVSNVINEEEMFEYNSQGRIAAQHRVDYAGV